MTHEPQQDRCAARRGVLLGAGLVGLAGLGGALAGCSTAAVPYDSNEAGQVPDDAASPSPARGIAATSGGAGGSMGGTSPGAAQGSGGSGPAGSGSAGSGSAAGGMAGTPLGMTSEIPVGGGKVFTAQQVVVTQPTAGQFRAFSAVCTHVGCICNKVANGTIDCPCHGSTFKISNGAVVTGPAASPLPAKSIAITDGTIMLL